MKIFGISPEQHEQKRIVLLRNLNVVEVTFWISLLTPIVIFLLFQFGVISAASPFTDDIQQPVAKVITRQSTGTAFLVSSTKLLTARHVVAHLKVGDNVDLIFERLPSPHTTTAKVIYIAPTSVAPNPDKSVDIEYFLTDFAVLELSQPIEVAPLFLGESESVNLLDEVILIGYPTGDYSITKGNINNDKFQGLDLFKLDATSNPGNSGGPCILKSDNTVIGILVGGSGSATQGENIAIKMTNIKSQLARANVNLEN